MSTKPREFWIEFSGDPSDDKECYKRYVSGTEFKPILPECEVLHVREILASEIVLDRAVVEAAIMILDDELLNVCQEMKAALHDENCRIFKMDNICTCSQGESD